MASHLAMPDRAGVVFPGAVTARMSPDMMRIVLRGMGVDATVHGFRSSFRDWAGNETNVAREVCEAALAHAVGGAVEIAYRRGDALSRRRELMDAWARFCEAPAGGEVVPLHASR